MDAERSYGTNWNKITCDEFISGLSYKQLKRVADSLNLVVDTNQTPEVKQK